MTVPIYPEPRKMVGHVGYGSIPIRNGGLGVCMRYSRSMNAKPLALPRNDPGGGPRPMLLTSAASSSSSGMKWQHNPQPKRRTPRMAKPTNIAPNLSNTEIEGMLAEISELQMTRDQLEADQEDSRRRLDAEPSPDQRGVSPQPGTARFFNRGVVREDRRTPGGP